MHSYGKLYLIPNFLTDDNPDDFIAGCVRGAVHHITRFIVEDEKKARALIRRLQLHTPQAELEIALLNEHTTAQEIPLLLKMLEAGHDCGIISDAGLPCIADPGAALVSYAQQRGITVIPLPGGSSILMALMASGLSGQSFVFHGYLPIDKVLREKKLKQIQADAVKNKQSQIFMEAPYRNNAILADVIKTCAGDIKLCIACNVSGAAGFIRTMTISAWKRQLPDLHKKPTIFIIGT